MGEKEAWMDGYIQGINDMEEVTVLVPQVHDALMEIKQDMVDNAENAYMNYLLMKGTIPKI